MLNDPPKVVHRSTKEFEIIENEINHGKIEKRRIAEDNRIADENAKERLRKKRDSSELTPEREELIKRILGNELPLKQRQQKYLQHVFKTKKYFEASKARRRVQSYLIVDEEEAQHIIYAKCGTGTCMKEGESHLYEYVTLDSYVGRYYEDGEWHKTRRVQIEYSKSGTHIIPVKEK